MLCVPALARLAEPWWDSAATVSFSGMTLSSGQGHLVRALLEGIAAQIAGLTGLITTREQGTCQPLGEIGGPERSRRVLQEQTRDRQLAQNRHGQQYSDHTARS